MRDRKESDQDGRRGGEELGGAEAGETVFSLFCMRKESMFNEREKETNKQKLNVI